VKNIAAYTAIDANRRTYWLIPGSVSGTSLLNSGLFALLKRVPASDAAWATDPFEAQYLKLYDVTPPPAPGAPTTSKPYVIGTSVTFTWPSVSDPEGGIASYNLTVISSGGVTNEFAVTGTSRTVTNTLGQTLHAWVSAVNNAGIEGPASTNGPAVVLLDPNGDNDADGMSNAAEDIAGTNPLDANSVLLILSLANGNLLTWSSVSNKTYRVQATANLATNFVPISGVVTAAGATANYLDAPATNSRRFYRVNVLP
jgi:hypothetical protein